MFNGQITASRDDLLRGLRPPQHAVLAASLQQVGVPTLLDHAAITEDDDVVRIWAERRQPMHDDEECALASEASPLTPGLLAGLLAGARPGPRRCFPTPSPSVVSDYL